MNFEEVHSAEFEQIVKLLEDDYETIIIDILYSNSFCSNVYTQFLESRSTYDLVYLLMRINQRSLLDFKLNERIKYIHSISAHKMFYNIEDVITIKTECSSEEFIQICHAFSTSLLNKFPERMI